MRPITGSFALCDPLTRLANRTPLRSRLPSRSASAAAVRWESCFCAVDGFKLVNDRWGHETGDRLLCRVADLLQAATRDTDTVARFAGDEFVVVCPGLRSAAELDAVVERVSRTVHAPEPGRVRPIAPRLSIGAALLADGETAYGVLRRADRAMYRAKAGTLLSQRRGASFRPPRPLEGAAPEGRTSDERTRA